MVRFAANPLTGYIDAYVICAVITVRKLPTAVASFAATFDRNKKFLRGEIAHRVNLRHAPELRFELDTSFGEGDKIDALLRKPEVKRDLGEG